MSKTATKRDLSDPKTIADFVDLVQTPERLRMLLCLTIVDIRAVGPNSWNNWKASLLRGLYWRAEALMLGSSTGDDPLGHNLNAIKAEIHAALKDKGWEETAINHYLMQAGYAYLLQYAPQKIISHANLVRNAREEPDQLHIEIMPDIACDITHISICCPVHLGVFSKIAGAITIGGGAVKSANIATLSDGLAIDEFSIQNHEGKCLASTAEIEHLQKLIHHALSNKINMGKRLKSQFYRPLSKREIEGTVTPSVLIDNKASATKTVIEIVGRDHPGMLYFLTCVLARLNLQVNAAKISTFGEKLVDVFYVRDLYGHKITRPERLKQIEDQLMACLNENDKNFAALENAHEGMA